MYIVFRSIFFFFYIIFDAALFSRFNLSVFSLRTSVNGKGENKLVKLLHALNSFPPYSSVPTSVLVCLSLSAHDLHKSQTPITWPRLADHIASVLYHNQKQQHISFYLTTPSSPNHLYLFMPYASSFLIRCRSVYLYYLFNVLTLAKPSVWTHYVLLLHQVRHL